VELEILIGDNRHFGKRNSISLSKEVND